MVSKRQTLSFISTFHKIKSNVIVLDETDCLNVKHTVT